MSSSAAAVPWTFSTHGLPEDQRIELWEAHNAAALVGLRCRTADARPLEASEANVKLDRLHLARVTGSAHLVERTADVIESSPADSVVAYFTLRGQAAFRHPQGTLTLRPGQLVICDVDRPFERAFSQGLEELAMKVPGRVFAELTGGRTPRSPLVFDFTDGPGSTARTLTRLVARAVRGGASSIAHEGTLLELLTVVAMRDRADSMLAHRANAHAYIEDQLADSALTASRVAAAVGISDRHLCRVFAEVGTSIPRHILHRRLDVAHALLSAAHADDITVADVAARCGFISSTYFSHAFRERFGLRAGEVRRQARDLRAH